MNENLNQLLPTHDVVRLFMSLALEVTKRELDEELGAYNIELTDEDGVIIPLNVPSDVDNQFQLGNKFNVSLSLEIV